MISEEIISNSETAPLEITIGQQVWMDRNLDVTVFRNGEPVPEAKTMEEWSNANGYRKPACCCLDFIQENAKYYGRFYNWFAVNDPRGLAPAGWHVPDRSEWLQLTDFLGGDAVAGRKMKSTHSWVEHGDGTNESGFNAFPSGLMSSGGYSVYKGSTGFWWSTSQDSAYHVLAYGLTLFNKSNGSFGEFYGPSQGFSVRCVKG